MNIVLLQARLNLEEIDLLLKEFPQYLFLSLSEASYKNLSPEHWSRVEIVYGNKLNPEDLEKAHQLRWIHSPQTLLNRISIEDIEKRGNILITNTVDENTFQIGEFVIGGILTFAKNLFRWKEAGEFPGLVWDSKWRDSMWTLKNRLHLQIGLSRIGTEITRRARQFDMRVWGIQETRSFHPHCQKTFSAKEMNSVLPAADVVCICHPRGKIYENWFQAEQLELMKNDSILVVIGGSNVVNEEALVKVSKTGKLRGIILDAFYQNPIPPSSQLWQIPNMIITPEVSPRPKSTERQSFRIFLYNLRQYLHGNFSDMRNLVNMKHTFEVR